MKKNKKEQRKMATNKITEDNFSQIKQGLVYLSRADAAKKYGLSYATIKRIDETDSIEEYRKNLRGTFWDNNQRLVREAKLETLTDEPLFWAVKGLLNRMSIPVLTTLTTYPCEDIIRKMRRCADYDEYISQNGSSKSPAARWQRARTTINEGLQRVIQLGKQKGYPVRDIASALCIAPQTVLKYLGNDSEGGAITEEDYNLCKNGKLDLNYYQRKSIVTSKDYLHWSVSYYTDGEAPWLDSEEAGESVEETATEETEAEETVAREVGTLRPIVEVSRENDDSVEEARGEEKTKNPEVEVKVGSKKIKITISVEVLD